MKTLAPLLLTLILVPSAAAQKTRWRSDVDKALHDAANQRKLAVLYFYDH